jgi:hypothetical protein
VEVTEQSGRSPNGRHDRQHFYKYVSAKTAKAILTTRKLRWSSPILFNDPFDITQELRLDFTVAEFSAAVVEELADLIIAGGPFPDTAHPGLRLILAALDGASLAQRQQIADGLRKGPGGPTVGQIDAMAELKRRWSAIVPKLRLLCLSESNDVTSMWHHYADAYQGAVLQFEAVDGLDSAWLAARPVVYQAAPPAIADARTWARCMLRKDERTYLDLFTEYQYTKTPDWAYEREWRLVTFALPEESGQFSYWRFDTRELVAVYLGPRGSEEDQADILALLTDGLEDVSVFRARITGAAGKFTFEALREPS